MHDIHFNTNTKHRLHDIHLKNNLIYNGNCTEWRAIWSEIKRVITKSHDRVAENFFGITLRLGYQELTYTLYWTHIINALLFPLFVFLFRIYNYVNISVNARNLHFPAKYLDFTPAVKDSPLNVSFLLKLNEMMSLLPKGIQNLGNTCFANSVLQSLLSVNRYGYGLLQMEHNRTRCLRERSGEKFKVYFFYP